MGSNLREVVGLYTTPEGGGNGLSIEAFVPPKISTVPNEHLEIVHESYPHLSNILLSDVCQHKEQLEIDVLIGADYMWNFQTGNVARGGVCEPVAVETQFGWVIPDPMEYNQSIGKDSAMTGRLIPDKDGVYKEFVDTISLNGNRYSVKLPWTERRDILDGNYELNLSRMKGQVKKLR